MSFLSCTDLSLTYPNGTRALRDVSLDVTDGEFIALVGPSGSGKTSLLRSIAGFVQPTAGTVRLGGTTVSGDGTWTPPEARGLGMVFQQHAIWPHWNVARNVDYPLRRAKVAPAERRRRVAHALELVDLAGYGDRSPATLSGGQRQRVALARALVSEPQVLLLDEALSALDEPLRAAMRVEIRTLAEREGLTVVHVTHDRDEALALADRVVVLREGAVEQVAPPQQLVEDPATPFVASFLGDANLLDVVRDGARLRLRDGGREIAVDEVREVGGSGAGADAAAPAATLAVLPEAVRLVPSPDGSAVVESSLFTRTGAQLQVSWDGPPLRVRSDLRGLRRGDRVDLCFEKALLYPTGAAAPLG